MPARDPRLREVDWKSLVALNHWETVWELSLSAPWLMASWWLFAAGLEWLGVGASFFFFLTGLRQSHGAQHGIIGLGKAGCDLALWALSVLMLSSMHAVQVTHLRHHRDPLGAEDAESITARLPWWRALLYGPNFIYGIHSAAWTHGTRVQRMWIAAELASVAAVVVFAVWGGVYWWTCHVAAMMVGECFTGFFCVWTVHHDCDPRLDVARTLRRPLWNWVFYGMFYHLEHHLFPAVPQAHLPELARRLDREAPRARSKLVF